MKALETFPPSTGSYIADPALETAARVAIELNQPLLLTGEPGTGKTSFAGFLAKTLAPRWLDLSYELPLFKFETKSTSVANDLFYRFDNLRRLHATHDKTMSSDNLDYITFEALGMAILLTRPLQELAELRIGSLAGTTPARSVVLIDEVDKASRDFPNDILNEVEQMYFKIVELRDKSGRIRSVAADPALRPLVVLSSNSEKNLPAAFLRRCVFHHIEFPERKKQQRLTDIITAHIINPPTRLTQEAIDFFYTLREDPRMDKLPATAELVQWMRLLSARAKALNESDYKNASLAMMSQEELAGTLGVLVKSVDDMRRARAHLAKHG